MYPNEPPRGRDAAASQQQLWTTISDFRYAAGLKLANDDFLDRVRAETALTMTLDEAGIETGWISVLGGPRRRIGAALVRTGRRLQGAAAAGAAVEAVPAGSSGGAG